MAMQKSEYPTFVQRLVLLMMEDGFRLWEICGEGFFLRRPLESHPVREGTIDSMRRKGLLYRVDSVGGHDLWEGLYSPRRKRRSVADAAERRQKRTQRKRGKE